MLWLLKYVKFDVFVSNLFLMEEQVSDAFFLTIREKVYLHHEEGRYFLEWYCSFRSIRVRTWHLRQGDFCEVWGVWTFLPLLIITLLYVLARNSVWFHFNVLQSRKKIWVYADYEVIQGCEKYLPIYEWVNHHYDSG